MKVFRDAPAALASFAAMLLLAGCVAAPFSVISDGDTTAVVHNDRSGGMDALVIGTVIIDDNGCWALESEGGGTMPVAWAPGTRLEDGRLAIGGIDGFVAPGDHVEAGGGELAAAALPDFDQPCWTGGTVAVMTDSGR